MTYPAFKENHEQFYGNFCIPVERVAAAIQQVSDVLTDNAWNEVTIRSTKQMQQRKKECN